MGIALVPYHAVRSRELSRSVAVLNVEGFPLRLNWSLIWRADELTSAAATLRDYLVRYQHKTAAGLPAASAALSSN